MIKNLLNRLFTNLAKATTTNTVGFVANTTITEDKVIVTLPNIPDTEYNIKDFGNVFPGHGGVLDRFDSILFIGLMFLSIFIVITQIYPTI